PGRPQWLRRHTGRRLFGDCTGQWPAGSGGGQCRQSWQCGHQWINNGNHWLGFMIKKLTLLILALLTIACTSQASRHDIVYFENTCTEAAEVLTENSSNFQAFDSKALLAPGEKAAIASYMLYTESIFEHISDDYKL